MQVRTFLVLLAIASGTACVGCAGSSGTGGADPEPIPARLSLTGDSVYNGSTSLPGSNSESVLKSAACIYRTVESNKQLEILLPTDQVAAGQTITVAGTSVDEASYVEQTGTLRKAWVASGGTVTLSAGPDGTLDGDLDLSFSPDPSAGNAGTGNFSLKGKLHNLYDPFRRGQDGFAIGFSNSQGFSGSTAAFPSSALIGAGTTEQNGLRISVSVQQPSLRSLEAQTDAHENGRIVNLLPGSSHDFVVYTEQTATETRVWRSASGSLTVGYVKLSGGKLTLKSVVLQPDHSVDGNKATGSVVVDGTLEKG